MSCLLLFCLAGIYVEGDVGYVLNTPRSDAMIRERRYWIFDPDETRNPRGNLSIGHEWNPTPKWRASIELRHESWIGTSKDHGLNGAWISLRYRPFAQ